MFISAFARLATVTGPVTGTYAWLDLIIFDGTHPESINSQKSAVYRARNVPRLVSLSYTWL